MGSCSSDCRGVTALLDKQSSGIQVAQIEFVFFLRIGRIQRRRCRASGNSNKCRSHLRTIRQYDRHAVIAPDAQTIKRFRRLRHEIAQFKVAQARSVDTRNRDAAVGACLQQFMNCGGGVRGWLLNPCCRPRIDEIDLCTESPPDIVEIWRRLVNDEYRLPDPTERAESFF